MGKDKLRVLVTGSAGFIGGSITSRLVASGHSVLGIDNFSAYYNPAIKSHHVGALHLNSVVSKVDICDLDALLKVYQDFKPEAVIHLAAQGGVRASQLDPEPYIQTNQMGFLNVLKLNSKFEVKKFVYASSSSVYGEGLQAPFHEDMHLPAPKSLYGASKVANELMAEHYPNINLAKRCGLRFFTVYGPWGRPDMAVSRLLVSGMRKSDFNLTANLELVRDFTYVEDVSDVLEDLVNKSWEEFPEHSILNVAGESPRTLGELITICEGNRFQIRIKQGPINPLDVSITHGSSLKLSGYGIRVPQTSLEVGIQKTVEWFTKPENSSVVSLLD